MGERLAAMLEAALVEPEVPAGQARAILQEMATALEELRVAEEELTVQAEQLTAAAEVVDAERERYGELFEFAPDAYLETDAHGKILIANADRKSTRLNSSHANISYAVFCLKKKNNSN